MGKTNTNTTFDAMEYHVLAYLDDIKGRIADVRACEERVAEIRHQMGVRGTTYSGMPGPPNAYGDAIPDGLAIIEEQKSRYDDELAIHGAEIDQRASNLCRPHASENRHLLWLEYVHGPVLGQGRPIHPRQQRRRLQDAHGRHRGAVRRRCPRNPGATTRARPSCEVREFLRVRHVLSPVLSRERAEGPGLPKGAAAFCCPEKGVIVAIGLAREPAEMLLLLLREALGSASRSGPSAGVVSSASCGSNAAMSSMQRMGCTAAPQRGEVEPPVPLALRRAVGQVAQHHVDAAVGDAPHHVQAVSVV